MEFFPATISTKVWNFHDYLKWCLLERLAASNQSKISIFLVNLLMMEAGTVFETSYFSPWIQTAKKAKMTNKTEGL